MNKSYNVNYLRKNVELDNYKGQDKLWHNWSNVVPMYYPSWTNITYFLPVYCYDMMYDVLYMYIHYIAKSIGSPPSNERFDYFSNFHEYKS